jgi:hypothetical protein
LHQKIGCSEIGEIQETGAIGLPAKSGDRIERFLTPALTPPHAFMGTDPPSALAVTLSPGVIFTVCREQDSDRYLLRKYSLEQAPGTEGLIIRMGRNDQDFV